MWKQPPPSHPLYRDAPFYVAGHGGLAGSAVWRRLERAGFTRLHGLSSRDLDLRDRDAVFGCLDWIRPKYVVIAVASVGGIRANANAPADFLSENLRIQTDVLDGSAHVGVERLLFSGSSCIYPRLAAQPIREDALLTGHLEPTNDAYAIAQIAGILHVQSGRRQYGLAWISAMPTNLYGPNDSFSPVTSHVLPALIRRYDEAVRTGADEVINWGSGSPRRECLHSDDLADAALHLLENYDSAEHVSVGTGKDATIRAIAAMIADATGFDGVTRWDTTQPDGTPQKVLDVAKLSATGWRPSVPFIDGITSTVAWYRAHRDTLRS